MQTFNVLSGQLRGLQITPRNGENPGTLTSLAPQWSVDQPGILEVTQATDGMSAEIRGLAPGSAVVTVAYQSVENAYPLRQEQCTVNVGAAPADNLLFTLI